METTPVLVQPIRPGRILVVDDDPQSRQLLRGILKENGHHVTEAVDGEDALAAIRREPPDVILLDVMMPRLDGFEVCRRVKGDPCTALIHILMITSLADHEHRMKGIECGANDFLAKPVQREEVLLHVRNAILTRQVIDELQERRDTETAEDTLLHRLRNLSTSDAGLAMALLTIGAEMLAWRVTTVSLDKSQCDRLYDVYKQLGAALAKSGASPA